MEGTYDAVIVGAGPNGLAAAVALTRAGCRTIVFEANAEVGGGARSAELTLSSFVHDICSAVHPLAIASPFLRTLPLAAHGLEWIYPPAELAHPLDDGTAALIVRSVQDTAATLAEDGRAYAARIGRLARHGDRLLPELLAPPLHWPRHPLALAGFGLSAVRSGVGIARAWFRGERARGLFAGLAAHSMLPLTQPISAAVALVLAMTAHGDGWPIPRGGAGRISIALRSYLETLGGEVVVNQRITAMRDLPPARVVLCDLTPRQLLALAGERLPGALRRRLARYRYGMAAYKMDWALDGPIPWKAPECARAGTVHLGGTLDEIVASEASAYHGRVATAPFVLLAQPSLFDPTRAPAGQHTAWAYCHVPHASTAARADAVEAQIERFAPGFARRVLARSILTPADLEQRNANLVGGDINGGVQDVRQLLLRPTLRTYTIVPRQLYLCSASTPPGGGVHGMCGYHAARTVLRHIGYREATSRLATQEK